MVAHVGTDVHDMILPVWSIDHIDTQVSVGTIPVLVRLIGRWLEIDAWGKSNELVHVCGVVVLFSLGKAVEHLCSAHRVANIVDLRLSADFNDLVHESRHIIHTKLGPTEIPSLKVLILFRVLLTDIAILSSPIVAHPDIVSLIIDLQMHWLASMSISEPSLCITKATWDSKHRHFVPCKLVSLGLSFSIINVSSDVE